MSTAIRITLDASAVGGALGGLAALLGPEGLAPVMRALRDELLDIRTQRFVSSRGVNGVPWAPKKRPVKGADLPLVVSGRLRDGIGSDATGASILLGSVLPYARIHEFGGTIVQHPYSRTLRLRPRRGKEGGPAWRFAANASKAKGIKDARATYGTRRITIPARPWLGWGKEDAAAAQDVLGRAIAAALRGAGGA